MKTYSVTLTGETPLLLHADNIAWSEKLSKWQKDPDNKDVSVAGDDRSPAWSWMGNAYHDGGNLCVPSDNLMTCIRDAGAKMILKGNATYKKIIPSAVVVDQAQWDIVGPKGTVSWEDLKPLLVEDDFSVHLETVEELGFELFCKRAKIGQSKHVRVRPRFNTWSVSGTITVLDDELVPESVLRKCLDIAGSRIGLCDWRPSAPKSPGSFGKFTADVKAL